jgi:hypothetical protein
MSYHINPAAPAVAIGQARRQELDYAASVLAPASDMTQLFEISMIRA